MRITDALFGLFFIAGNIRLSIEEKELPTTRAKNETYENNLSLILNNSNPCEQLVDESQVPWCLAVKECSTHSRQNNLCSILLASESSTYLSKETKDVEEKKKPCRSAVWGYGFLCVTIISITSLLGVGVLPLMSKSFYHKLLTSLIGLAVGSLTGSALFHLIPSAFLLADFYHHHAYLNTSIYIFGGVYLFFIIERVMKIVMEYKNLNQGTSSNTYSKAESGEKVEGDPESWNDGSIEGCVVGYIHNASDKNQVYQNSKPAIKASFGLLDKPENDSRPTVEKVRSLENPESRSAIATVAWMIIFGDGVHNFIDGLSIGAAFTESILTGISVSIAVFCEEFPHELGDFAVLLNAGMTIKQAMIYNFLSACTCYLGLIIGILLSGLDFGNHYIFALAGGMFLYISLVDMVPELNETIDKVAKVNIKEALCIFLIQNIGILIGIGSLFFLAKYQDDIQIGA
ncbi:metal cation symporter ZIP14 [Lepeophtheirus salmonis]|uniref:metal cation symporter ZIP14 n=1 Tax=Lepeophtheirus salmonis TaxID=72036 RepID=UPI001AE2B27E|nr:metal cation symporter ZIP14-like [Lepeophtheirus salmonis]